MGDKKKTRAQLEREIDQALRAKGRLLAGSSTVLPHRKTSAACKTCGRFHTQADHLRHGDPAEVKARGKGKKKGSGRTGGSAPRQASDPLAIVRDAVRRAPARARFGRDDVFIYPLWRSVGKELQMSLDEFKRWLVEQNRAQNLALVRADLVDAMDPTLVERSEIEDLGAQFHFVVDPGRREVARRTKQTRGPAPRTIQGDIDRVREAARSIHGPGRFGDRKVFISELWRRVGKELGLSLDDFKRWLVARNRSEDLRLSRADLVSAMEPSLVAASETFANPGESYPVYHFVIDDSVR